jgi:uncharacterized membrane protein YedE/YeeE
MPGQFINALLGGILIGIACLIVLWVNGRLLGISGLIDAVTAKWDDEDPWRAAFLGGLIGGGILLQIFTDGFTYTLDRSPIAIALAGFLVGLGARMGNGCTSGHGICGNSRFSPRSLSSTITFIAAGAATVTLVRVGFGGAL